MTDTAELIARARRLADDFDCFNPYHEDPVPLLHELAYALTTASLPRPIASAPMDGTRILAWVAPNGIWTVVHSGLYRGEADWLDDDDKLLFDYNVPTRWMPLPPPPK